MNSSIQPIRVLVLHNCTLLQGGGEIVVSQEVRLLQDAGVIVRCLFKYNSQIGLGRKLALFFSPAFSRESYGIVANAISSFQPTLIHVHNFMPQWTWAVFKASIDRGIPVVHTMHTYGLVCPANLMLTSNGCECDHCVDSSKFMALVKRCKASSEAMKIMNVRSLSSSLARAVVRSDLFTVIALTPFARHVLLSDGIPEKNVIVKPHCTRRNHNPSAPHVSRNVLFVGRLSYEKGVDHIIREFHKIKDLGLQLRIIGDGPQKTELQKLAEALSLADRVCFLGAQPREICAKEYASSLCVVINSRTFEGFGLVVIEAFAAGVPIVAPDFGAMHFIVRDGYNGLLVNPATRDLATKIEVLHRQPEICKRIGRNARDSFERWFTPEKNLNLLFGSYKYAIQKSHKPVPDALASIKPVRPSEASCYDGIRSSREA